MGKRVVTKIHELTEEKYISVRKLAKLAGVRPEPLYKLAHQQRKNINIGHIERIAETLNVDDIRKIITLEDTDEGG